MTSVKLGNYDIKVKVINDSKLISNIDEYTKESIFNSVEKIFSNQNHYCPK